VALPEDDGNYYYAAAYKEAADKLVQAVLDKRLAKDSAIYPTLYLYRHYVELMLKEIIELGAQLDENDAIAPEHHKIDQLWQDARTMLERAFPDEDKEDADAVERIVRELASVDASGEAFRYSRRKRTKEQKRNGEHGDPTLPAPRQLNLDNMRHVMNRVAMFLDACCAGMQYLLAQ
jgi:hypothetical protein